MSYYNKLVFSVNKGSTYAGWYTLDTNSPNYTYVSPYGPTTINDPTISPVFLYNDQTLTRVIIADTVTQIENSTFSLCRNLISVTIGSGVTSIGDSAFFQNGITSLILPPSLTTIGVQAFGGTYITSIIIPNTVTSLGNYLFTGCTSLTSIDLNQVVTFGNFIFNGCSSLNNIIIPNTLTNIGNSTFNNCTSLDNISFQSPCKITTWETVFGGCTKLTTFTMPDSVTSTSGSVASGSSLISLILSNNLTILYEVTSYNTTLKYITIGTGTTSIRAYAFRECYNLQYFTFLGTQLPSTTSGSFIHIAANSIAYLQPTCYNYLSIAPYFAVSNIISVNNVTFTQNNVQYTTYAGSANDTVYISGYIDDPLVTILNIPSTVTNNDISYNVSYIGVSYTTVTITSSYVTTVNIPYDVSYINSTAFSGCSALTTFVVDPSNAYFSSYNGFILNTSQTSLVLAPNGIQIITASSFPSTLTSLGDYILSGLKYLTSVTLSNAITTLGNYIFNGCSSLVDISFQSPCQITYLGDDLFNGCTSLTIFTMPDSVTSSARVFYNSPSIETVTFSNNLTTIGQEIGGQSLKWKNAIIGTGTTTIGFYAFATHYTNQQLSNFTFMGTTTPSSINEYAFYFSSPKDIRMAYLQPNCYNYLSLMPYFAVSNIISVNNVTFTQNNIQYTTYAGSANDTVYVSGCTNSSSVTSLTIPSTVTNNGITYNIYYIGVSYTTVTITSFYVTTVNIPYDVSYINPTAFSGCPALTTFVVDENHPNFSSYNGYILNKSQTSIILSPNVTTITSNSFPPTLTTLNNYALTNNIYLITVILPSTVTSLGNYVFNGCTSLANVYTNNVTTIGTHLFYGCTNLHTVIFGKPITTIGGYTFQNCNNIDSVTFEQPSSMLNTYGDTYGSSINYYIMPDSAIDSLNTFLPFSYGNINYLYLSNGLTVSNFIYSFNYITVSRLVVGKNMTHMTIFPPGLTDIIFLGDTTPVIPPVSQTCIAYVSSTCNYSSLLPYFPIANIIIGKIYKNNWGNNIIYSAPYADDKVVTLKYSKSITNEGRYFSISGVLKSKDNPIARNQANTNNYIGNDSSGNGLIGTLNYMYVMPISMNTFEQKIIESTSVSYNNGSIPFDSLLIKSGSSSLKINTTLYNYYVFTSGTYTIIPTNNLFFYYLAVGGGGAGGNSYGGGGGAGGVRYEPVSLTQYYTYTITVGAGGSLQVNGGNSTITGSDISNVIAYGGGYGAGSVSGNAFSSGTPSSIIGSGGGGAKGYLIGGQTSSGQGFNGGNTVYYTPSGLNGGGGGGGGAGGIGASSVSSTPIGAVGGKGVITYSSILSDISASMNTIVTGWGNTMKDASGSYYIAGGGAGGTYNDGSFNTVSSGGLGGGGAGGMYNPITKQRIYPSNGITNTGGGGGGGSDSSANSIVGGSGGSGLVVLQQGKCVIDTLSNTTQNAMINRGTTLSAGAFGVILLYTRYTGPVMTIKRSSDSSYCDFYADISGNLGMGYLATGTTLNTWLNGATAYLTKWWDQTGNANHATQTTVGKIPIFDTYYNYIRFNDQCFLNLPDGAYPYGNSAYTFVFKCSIARDGGGVFSGGSLEGNKQNAFIRYYNGNGYLNTWYANDMGSSSGYEDNNVITLQYSQSYRYIYTRGNLLSSGAASSRNQPATNNYIGKTGYGDGSYLNGTLNYFYYAPISISTTDRNILEATYNSITSITPSLYLQSYLPLLTDTSDNGLNPQTVTTVGDVTFDIVGGKKCVYFNNSISNYLYFNFNNNLRFTFCFWIYIIDTSEYTACSISNITTLIPSFQSHFWNNNTFIYLAMPNFWNYSSYALSGGNTGKWIHVAYIVDQLNYTGQMYVNGSLATSVTGTAALGKNTSHWILGKSGDNQRAFNGYIRQFQLYNTILTGSQIQSIYNDTMSLGSVTVNTNTYIMDQLTTTTKTAMLNTGTTLSAGAFGLKLLYSIYSGPVLTIRRSSDSSYCDFYADISGNLGTGYLATGTSLTSWLSSSYAYVTKWWDQTGNQNHATQTTTSIQPIYNTTEKYIDFGNTTTGGNVNAYLNLPNGAFPYGNSAYSYIFKHGVKNASYPYGTVYFGGQAGVTNNTCLFRFDDTNSYRNAWWSNDMNTPNNSYVNYAYVTDKYNGTNRNIYINSVSNNLTYSVGSGGVRTQQNINNALGVSFGAGHHYNSQLYYFYFMPISISSIDRIVLEST